MFNRIKWLQWKENFVLMTEMFWMVNAAVAWRWLSSVEFHRSRSHQRLIRYLSDGASDWWKPLTGMAVACQISRPFKQKLKKNILKKIMKNLFHWLTKAIHSVEMRHLAISAFRSNSIGGKYSNDGHLDLLWPTFPSQFKTRGADKYSFHITCASHLGQEKYGRQPHISRNGHGQQRDKWTSMDRLAATLCFSSHSPAVK